ncbi:MAG: DUF4082 domain-containing protein, partial [Bacteroidales bacterium]|nr:DUF4082 domain-containing protein [Bacteroidales bacterium]
GGTGVFAYQWYSSPDGSSWSAIAGATAKDYTPPALTSGTWYRRSVMSGALDTVNSNAVLVSVSPQLSLAQLHDNLVIDNNTSTNIRIELTGGTAPYTISYTRNGITQPVINHYYNNESIYTGVLNTGGYTYILTSVTDSVGCSALDLGSQIHITAVTGIDSLFRTEIPDTSSNDAGYELGTQFQTYSNGYFTKARLFSHINEGGNHTIRLWMYNGSGYSLVAGPYIWNFEAGMEGWREFKFPSPVIAEMNRTYILSISNSSDYYYVKTENFSYTQHGEYLRYIKGTYSPLLDSVPTASVYSSNYYRDIVFALSDADTLIPGTIGSNQTICYNSIPSSLTQLTSPFGGVWQYEYQWQTSSDDTIWSDIPGAFQPVYNPPALLQSAFYRLQVTSGSYGPVFTNTVLITVPPQLSSAQLHDSTTIISNSAANFNIAITGGVSPYLIHYTVNGIDQTPISGYTSGTLINTGVLTTGVYTYALTSVTDNNGCEALNLESNIAITVIDNGDLNPGTVGIAQSICYNSLPAPLVQLSAPTGGTGEYTYLWQSSTDSIVWMNIDSAVREEYAPPALFTTTYFRRIVSSGSYIPVIGNHIKIVVSPQISGVQLHDSRSIINNSSTTFYVDIAGGIAPFTINYNRNELEQTEIDDYYSGVEISTGILTNGSYTYSLTSVTDSLGCVAENLGTSININVTDYLPVDSLYRTEVPTATSNDGQYELGSEFEVLADGFIIKAKVFAHINEGGDHIIRVWSFNGSSYSLYAGPYIWNFASGVNGWREYTFPSPIEVDAGSRYIISITNGPDMNYVRSEHFLASAEGLYVRYLRGLYSMNLGEVPSQAYLNSSYFRDIVFAVSNDTNLLRPGTIGSDQTICYNAIPYSINEITGPSGGTGEYTFQWQSSVDNSTWTNIAGAIQKDYAPSALFTNTYFRRIVYSDSVDNAVTSSVRITVSPQIALAQLYDNLSVPNNTSTYFNVVISGGTAPYTINYTRNGVPQTTLINYFSGTSIATGVLSTGNYIYKLTSVTDAYSCAALSLGDSIFINVSDTNGVLMNTNKALVLINTTAVNYSDYDIYIKPYLINFGIPYDLIDVVSDTLPDLNNYAVIIFGHNRVYESDYPITQLENVISNGVGLYSFDPHLFDYSSNFNTLTSTNSVVSTQVLINNTNHFITEFHEPDSFSPNSNIVPLRYDLSVTQRSNLNGGINLATVTSSGNTASLLQIASFGNGRIVRWTSYDWVYDYILGPVSGLDDIIWRGIVWAARKPFVMMGLPPMLTMRVDDVDGLGGGVTDNFRWIQVCNEFGVIPWCGTFNNTIPVNYISTFRTLLNNNQATAFPHAFSPEEFIYFNHNNLPDFDPVQNIQNARDFYIANNLPFSKYCVPHYYEISSATLPVIDAIGIEFIAIHMLPDNPYYGGGASWINCGPYRINRDGYPTYVGPVYYGGTVNLNGIEFFNCLAEIRDDGGYEWFPDNDVAATSARGIRHLRRSFNSMVLASLFTHEQYFEAINETNWREIFSRITSSVSEFNPAYTSTDYAIQYIRAKNNIAITNVVETLENVEITISGSNDMETKCMLFSESDGQISHRYVQLPQANGIHMVTIVK